MFKLRLLNFCILLMKFFFCFHTYGQQHNVFYPYPFETVAMIIDLSAYGIFLGKTTLIQSYLHLKQQAQQTQQGQIKRQHMPKMIALLIKQ